MISFINNNKVLLGLVLTFAIAGIGGVTGLVSPTTAVWLGMIGSGLTTLGHSYNLITGVKSN